jgi:L-ascorbate metabolism protein UlaG (beta-lactamase superfamily)
MKLQLVRSATLRLTIGQHTFVIDPYLAPKHGMPSYTGRSRNPLVDLPFSAEEALSDVEMVLLSHLHSDHFDPTAQDLLPSQTPIFCQPGDRSELRERGFSSVNAVRDLIEWQGITISRTSGRHGSGNVLEDMGHVSGFLFQAQDEPTLYWTGDTVWYQAVADQITQSQPDIIVTHSGGAVWGDGVPIIMDAKQTVEVCRAAPGSVVIAVHMEALDHCTVSRAALRSYADEQGIPAEQLLIPDDGETLAFVL